MTSQEEIVQLEQILNVVSEFRKATLSGKFAGSDVFAIGNGINWLNTVIQQLHENLEVKHKTAIVIAPAGTVPEVVQAAHGSL